MGKDGNHSLSNKIVNNYKASSSRWTQAGRGNQLQRRFKWNRKNHKGKNAKVNQFNHFKIIE